MSKVSLLPDSEFNVGKIVCIGRNYVKHIEEMKSERTAEPVLFLKPATSILHVGQSIVLPDYSREIHHEVEMALLIGKPAQKVAEQEWTSIVAGVGIALDLTLRDRQSVAKEKGLPWSVAKGFDGACPISDFLPLDQAGDIANRSLKLWRNGELRQDGHTSHMIFKPELLISYISKIFTLEPGDIVLTGTPAGVGPLQHGDQLRGKLQNVAEINFRVA